MPLIPDLRCLVQLPLLLPHAQNFSPNDAPSGTTIKPAAVITPILLCLNLYFLLNPLCLDFLFLVCDFLARITNRLQWVDCYFDNPTLLFFPLGNLLLLDIFFVVLPESVQYFFSLLIIPARISRFQSVKKF
jgi:hypothetical protein